MIPEDLPDNMQEALKHLGHGSSTIETNVHVALEASVDLAGFSERVEILMDSLAQEAICTKAVFCGIHEGVVLDAAKFLEWINGTKRLNVEFTDIGKFKTLWDVPDTVLPNYVFASWFEVACKLLSHDLSIVRIADQSARRIPVKWVNIP
ncbi:MAG: hypothetical protein WA130_08650 [Candidatus Methanoperedens sp.]